MRFSTAAVSKKEIDQSDQKLKSKKISPQKTQASK